MKGTELNKKIKFRKGAENQETKKSDEEDPDVDISIEEIRRKIREEKEAEGGGPQANSRLEESTDSHFTIIYEGVPGLPEQYTEVETVRLYADTSQDSVSPGRSNNKKEIFGGKADTSQDSVSPGGSNNEEEVSKGKAT